MLSDGRAVALQFRNNPESFGIDGNLVRLLCIIIDSDTSETQVHLGAAGGAEGAVELMEDVPLRKQITVEVCHRPSLPRQFAALCLLTLCTRRDAGGKRSWCTGSSPKQRDWH